MYKKKLAVRALTAITASALFVSNVTVAFAGTQVTAQVVDEKKDIPEQSEKQDSSVKEEAETETEVETEAESESAAQPEEEQTTEEQPTEEQPTEETTEESTEEAEQETAESQESSVTNKSVPKKQRQVENKTVVVEFTDVTDFGTSFENWTTEVDDIEDTTGFIKSLNVYLNANLPEYEFVKLSTKLRYEKDGTTRIIIKKKEVPTEDKTVVVEFTDANDIAAKFEDWKTEVEDIKDTTGFITSLNAYLSKNLPEYEFVKLSSELRYEKDGSTRVIIKKKEVPTEDKTVVVEFTDANDIAAKFEDWKTEVEDIKDTTGFITSLNAYLSKNLPEYEFVKMSSELRYEKDGSTRVIIKKKEVPAVTKTTVRFIDNNTLKPVDALKNFEVEYQDAADFEAKVKAHLEGTAYKFETVSGNVNADGVTNVIVSQTKYESLELWASVDGKKAFSVGGLTNVDLADAEATNAQVQKALDENVMIQAMSVTFTGKTHIETDAKGNKILVAELTEQSKYDAIELWATTGNGNKFNVGGLTDVDLKDEAATDAKIKEAVAANALIGTKLEYTGEYYFDTYNGAKIIVAKLKEKEVVVTKTTARFIDNNTLKPVDALKDFEVEYQDAADFESKVKAHLEGTA